jgi:hypothetical protein
MKLGDKVWHKRHSKWEAFDRIELDVVPRYKTSGLSGDEWRTYVAVRFSFKGVVVHEWQTRDMQTAILLLGYEWTRQQEPIPTEVIEREKGRCDQPGCANEAPRRFLLKSLFSDHGDRLDPADQSLRYFRQFCDEHAQRGDCGREDSDANYEQPAAVTP